MYNDTDHHSGSRAQSTNWIIDARWYYAILGYFLGVIIPDHTFTQFPVVILTVFFLLVIGSNIFFYLNLRRSKGEMSEKQLDIINRSQVAIDLVFFFVILLLTEGGIGNSAHSFFFIPIVISMILFGFRGAIIVATTSGLLVFMSVLVHSEVPSSLFMGESLQFSPSTLIALAHASVIFLLFLLVGFFGGYMSRLLSARDQLLLEQIKKEGGHVKRLEDLTQEFDQSAKLLVRRDLQLSSANEKLTQLDKMKSEIISIVAHQLRTPLSAIKWTLKILIDGDVGPVTLEQRELLTKGFESNERMIGLVNDVLAVDRLESGRLKYEFIPVQFEEIVQDMIRSLLPLATQNNIRVEFSSPEHLLPKIKIDPDKMHDVLQNLIDNAIKYTRKGGIVVVGVAMDQSQLHFWVKDNGIGIPEDEKEKIFLRFFRAGNAVRTKTEGSGLGLFIAQSIVKRHGGDIWFESELGIGTTFHVTLPFTQ